MHIARVGNRDHRVTRAVSRKDPECCGLCGVQGVRETSREHDYIACEFMGGKRGGKRENSTLTESQKDSSLGGNTIMRTREGDSRAHFLSPLLHILDPRCRSRAGPIKRKPCILILPEKKWRLKRQHDRLGRQKTFECKKIRLITSVSVKQEKKNRFLIRSTRQTNHMRERCMCLILHKYSILHRP